MTPRLNKGDLLAKRVTVKCKSPLGPMKSVINWRKIAIYLPHEGGANPSEPLSVSHLRNNRAGYLIPQRAVADDDENE
jgi:hypothetical protein